MSDKRQTRMKSLRKVAVTVVLSIWGILVAYVVVTVAIWIVSRSGLLGEIPIGYYRDFYLAKHSIKATFCVESMAFSRHEDLTLEDFHFKVRTKTGRLLRLWFHDYQHVSAICSQPRGILLEHPTDYRVDQGYNIQTIADRLSADPGEVTFRDILCRIDELVPLFEANYESSAIPRVPRKQQYTKEYRSYLILEIVDERRNKGGWIETPIE